MISLKTFVDTSFAKKNRIGIFWKDIVGEVLSRKCSPKKMDSDTLFLYSLSPSWSYHINAIRHDIIRKVNEKMGTEISKIKILNTSFSKSHSKEIKFYNEEKAFQDFEPENTENLFKEIKDKCLRERLEKVSSLSLARKPKK